MGREAYETREQAYVKHTVLKKYLQLLAMKVGHFRPGTTLNYLDGFSGPWDAVADDWNDSSPYIAAAELNKAQSILTGSPSNIPFTVRCMFVESDKDAYERLQGVRASFPGTDIVTFCGEFEAHIGQAIQFAQTGQNPFCFAFIDPTGWSGYGLKRITPLLRVRPSEVLINFMTKDVIRFIDDEESSAIQSFQDLFGETAYRQSWRGLSGLAREDAIVQRYCERVREAGKFDYCVSAVVLNPTVDRTHYHLVYATRSVEGLVAFREVERQTVETQRTVRGEARARKEQGRTTQIPLFSLPPPDSGYLDQLQDRYRLFAQEGLLTRLSAVGTDSYDALLCSALAHPLVSEATFKQILKRLQGAGNIEILGLKERQRVPRRRSGVRIRLLSGSSST